MSRDQSPDNSFRRLRPRSGSALVGGVGEPSRETEPAVVSSRGRRIQEEGVSGASSSHPIWGRSPPSNVRVDGEPADTAHKQ